LITTSEITRLNISGNYSVDFESRYHDSAKFIEPIASMLKTNSVITKLNVSLNNLNEKACKILAQGIKGNGTLEELVFGDTKPVEINTSMADANFGGRDLGPSGAIVLVAWLQTFKGMLASLDLSKNQLGVKGAESIASLLTVQPKSRNAFLRIATSCLILRVAMQTDNGLTSLDISGNDLEAGGAEHLAKSLRANT
jgi:hypothetical protein